VSWAPLRPVGRSRRAQARSGAFLEQWNLIVRYHSAEPVGSRDSWTPFADAVPLFLEESRVRDRRRDRESRCSHACLPRPFWRSPFPARPLPAARRPGPRRQRPVLRLTRWSLAPRACG